MASGIKENTENLPEIIANIPSESQPDAPCGICWSIQSKSGNALQAHDDKLKAKELENYLVHGYIRLNDENKIMISVIICVIERYFSCQRWFEEIWFRFKQMAY